MTVTTSAAETTPSPEGDLLERLLGNEVLVPTGVDGLYGRSSAYQAVAEGIATMVGRWSAELGATTLRFPPLLARSTFAHTNYLESFPDLMGSLHVFTGGNAEHKELLGRVEHGGDWPALLEPADVVAASATCHSVYPTCTGTLPPGGRYFDLSGWCFRHEPSRQATRMQSFVMHEVVYVGTAEGAWAHKETGLAHGIGMLESLGLELEAVAATDPFFGRVGTVLAAGQLDEQLKTEGVTAIAGTKGRTAIISGNCHRDHFGRPFDIVTAEGETAHSACVAFGVDRVTVALFGAHGLDPRTWPEAVRARLGL